MGNTLRREFLSTWSEPDVQKWKQRARESLKELWRSFSAEHNGKNWSLLDDNSRLKIIKQALIQSATPTHSLVTIGRGIADNILSKIYSETERVRDFTVDLIFVHCKQGPKEYSLPILRLQWQSHGGQQVVRFIDHTCRVYNDWDDWKYTNKYPMMKYCYPSNGCYDEKQLVKFGTSPVCDTRSRTFRVLDVLASTVSLSTAIVNTFVLFGLADFITVPVFRENDKLGIICTAYGYYW